MKLKEIKIQSTPFIDIASRTHLHKGLCGSLHRRMKGAGCRGQHLQNIYLYKIYIYTCKTPKIVVVVVVVSDWNYKLTEDATS